MKIFKITHIPKLSWSSKSPFNFKPNLKTFFFLIFGLFFFGFGEALLIISNFGVTPWTVLAEGVANITNITVGMATFIISISILLLWIPLKQKPGLGTICNAIIIALSIDLFVFIIPKTISIYSSILIMLIGIFLVGFGSAIYLTTNLGPGTRDGLMKGISENYKKPITFVRLFIELIVVILGWLLGGTVGLGTMLFALLIGPCISINLLTIKKINKT